MTERLYRDDPYLLEFDATVVARRKHQGQPAVVLDRTAFYAEAGGQPWDTGLLGGVAVVAVVEDAGEVLHVLEHPLAAYRVRGIVDRDRRRDHRQQHHGQHLLSRAFVQTAGAATASFHLGAEVSTIDLDRDVTEEQAAAAETRANEVVWEARPVRVRSVSRAEAQALGVVPPEEAGDSVRLVEAVGFDVQACGGTHPVSTAEVGVVIILGRERYKGGTRVHFVCGHRALALARGRNALLDRMGVMLSSAIERLPEAVQRALDQVEVVEKRSRELLFKVIEGEAHRLIGLTEGSPCVVVSIYEDWPPTDLRALAMQLVSITPCIALLGSRTDKAHLVFAQTDGLPYDVPSLLREAAEIVGGRGGGRGNVAQGGGDLVECLDQALARAAALLRGEL